MPPTSHSNGFDEQMREVHEYFAAYCFNQAWHHLSRLAEDPEAAELAVGSAYTSLYHFRFIGTPQQFVRGEWLISHIGVRLHRPSLALHHARRALDLALRFNLQDWDLAYAYEGVARAHACAGHFSEARQYKNMAREAGSRIMDTNDRQQFEMDLTDELWYGVE